MAAMLRSAAEVQHEQMIVAVPKSSTHGRTTRAKLILLFL
jgi:hypothetical protein